MKTFAFGVQRLQLKTKTPMTKRVRQKTMMGGNQRVCRRETSSSAGGGGAGTGKGAGFRRPEGVLALALGLDDKPLDVIHRDVSPQNVLVLYTGQAKLTEFKTAKSRESAATRTGAMKVRYLAPEVLGEKAVDARIDVFSAGILLFEMLTGQRFWGDRGDLDIIRQLTDGFEPPSLRARLPDVSPSLENVYAKAIAARPEDRFASARDFASAIEELRISSSARDVGRFMGETFAAERAASRALAEGSSRSLPTDGLVGDHAAPWQPPQDIDAASPSARSGTAKAQRALLLGACLLLAVLGVALAAAGFRGRLPAGSRVASTSAAPTSSVPPADTLATAPIGEPGATRAEPPKAEVVIVALPASAAVFVDGAKVSNPFRAVGSQDPRKHVVRITAPGFVTATRTVSFDSSLNLEVSLSPAYAHHPSPPPAAERAAPPQQPARDCRRTLPPRRRAGLQRSTTRS